MRLSKSPCSVFCDCDPLASRLSGPSRESQMVMRLNSKCLLMHGQDLCGLFCPYWCKTAHSPFIVALSATSSLSTSQEKSLCQDLALLERVVRAFPVKVSLPEKAVQVNHSKEAEDRFLPKAIGSDPCPGSTELQV